MKRTIWLLQAGAFYLITWLFSRVPDGFTRQTGAFIGRLIYLLVPGRRRVTEQNIRSSFTYMQNHPNWGGGERGPEELCQQVFSNIGQTVFEISRLYHGRGEAILQRVEIRGIEHHLAVKAKGKGVLFLTGHFGNWELMPLSYACQFSTAVSAVARKLDNPYLNTMIEKMRMQYNNQIIYKHQAIKSMISIFKQGGTVGLLVDQAVTPNEGYLIDFLGRKAWASKAPVLIARKTGVAVLPGFIYREGNQHILQFLPELEFSNNTSDEATKHDVQAYSKVLEQFVIEHPESWFWIHKRWKRTEGL